jgi:hypothetical protein
VINYGDMGSMWKEAHRPTIPAFVWEIYKNIKKNETSCVTEAIL